MGSPVPIPRNDAEPKPSNRELKEETGAVIGVCCVVAGASGSGCTLEGNGVLS